MGKSIWILNHYAGETFFDKGGRHYSIAKYLRRKGYKPTVFCSNSKHGEKKQFISTEERYVIRKEEEIDVPYVFIRNRLYSTNGIDRIANMIEFYFSMLRIGMEYGAKNGTPDIIYASSVHPLTLVAGIKLAKKYGVKCVCEVRDLWPESIVEYSEKLTERNPIIRLLYLGEKWIYKKCDALIFTFERGYDYIIEKGWTKDIPESKVFYVNNGVDLEVFEYNKEHFTIEDEDLENDDLFKIVYTGSIRKVNNLGRLLDIAKLVTDPAVRFLVWGDGDELEQLKDRVNNEGIGNVKFKGRVDKKYIPYITSKADVNLAHNNPSKLFRFGISFNKIFDYLAAGKPILLDFESKGNPIISVGAAIPTEGYEDKEIAHAVDTITGMSGEKIKELYRNSMAGANKYNYKNLTKELTSIFL